jgi:hypothetical protein
MVRQRATTVYFCVIFSGFLKAPAQFEPAHLKETVSVQPVATIIHSSWVIADLDIGQDGRVHLPTVLKGDETFRSKVLSSVSLWTFSPAQLNGPVESHVTGVFLFRSRDMFGAAPPDLSGIQAEASDSGPIPVSVTDPGHLATSVAEGEVVLDLRISESGSIQDVRTVKGILGLTEFTNQAVRSWKFATALMSGKAVAGTVIVTISYMRPAVG